MDQPPPIIEPPKKDTNWHNTIATYMSRHVRHVRARSNEWISVHRSGGGGGSSGGGGSWGVLFIVAGMVFACWIAYHVFIWLVDIIQRVIQGVCTCVIAAVPYVLLIGIGLVVVTWFWHSHRS